MAGLGKIFLILGITLIVAGILLISFHKIPFIGKLPGDILIKKDNFTFYFPMATSIIISIFLTLIFLLFSKFRH